MGFTTFGFWFYVSALAFGFLLAVLFFKSLNASTANLLKLNMTQSQNLSLIPTDELIAEIGNRYDHMIFIGLKHTTPINYDTKRRYKGNLFLCLGLTANMDAFLNELVAVSEQPHDGKGT